MTTNSPRAYVVLQTAKTKKFVFTGKRFLGNSSIFVEYCDGYKANVAGFCKLICHQIFLQFKFSKILL